MKKSAGVSTLFSARTGHSRPGCAPERFPDRGLCSPGRRALIEGPGISCLRSRPCRRPGRGPYRPDRQSEAREQAIEVAQLERRSHGALQQAVLLDPARDRDGTGTANGNALQPHDHRLRQFQGNQRPARPRRGRPVHPDGRAHPRKACVPRTSSAATAATSSPASCPPRRFWTQSASRSASRSSRPTSPGRWPSRSRRVLALPHSSRRTRWMLKNSSNEPIVNCIGPRRPERTASATPRRLRPSHTRRIGRARRAGGAVQPRNGRVKKTEG